MIYRMLAFLPAYALIAPVHTFWHKPNLTYLLVVGPLVTSNVCLICLRTAGISDQHTGPVAA